MCSSDLVLTTGPPEKSLEFALNILTKELALELGDTLNARCGGLFSWGVVALQYVYKFFGMPCFKSWSLIPFSLSEGWA